MREKLPQQRYREALLREFDFDATRLGKRRLASIFFGGGTPSLMEPETVARLIDHAKSHFSADGELEITLEANPTSVEIDRLAAFKDAGINRLSLGIQSLNDQALSFLGREHSSKQARDALYAAKKLFENVSFDLIYARPDQTIASWRDELSEALTLAGDHLSLYQLTIEEGTRFASAYRQNEFTLPSEAKAARLYHLTDHISRSFGLRAYEISNYARPGFESRHNLAYWRYEDYLGIGPGAHSRLTRHGKKYAVMRARSPEAWLKRIDTASHAIEEESLLTTSEMACEALLMGMRLENGVDLAAFHESVGAPLFSFIDRRNLRDLCAEGYLLLTSTHLKASHQGRIRLNSIIARLIT